MSFNTEVTKQAQEVTFSCKSQKATHSKAYFRNPTVIPSSIPKHLGINSLQVFFMAPFKS